MKLNRRDLLKLTLGASIAGAVLPEVGTTAVTSEPVCTPSLIREMYETTKWAIYSPGGNLIGTIESPGLNIPPVIEAGKFVEVKG